MKAIDRVIIYLYRTRIEEIKYGDFNRLNLLIYRDVSFADNLETRRLSYRYIIILFSGVII